MGVETTTTITVTCDNPACPGNSLDPASYDGWIQLTAAVKPPTPEGQVPMPGFPIQQILVYCSPTCAGSVEQTLLAAEDAREAAAEEQPV